MTYKTSADASSVTWIAGSGATGPKVWFQGAWYGVVGGKVLQGTDDWLGATTVLDQPPWQIMGLHVMDVPAIRGGLKDINRRFITP